MFIDAGDKYGADGDAIDGESICDGSGAAEEDAGLHMSGKLWTSAGDTGREYGVGDVDAPAAADDDDEDNDDDEDDDGVAT